MATATTTTIPPPTANTLKPYQRSRLMKSTQKLGKILGTTPYLIESSDLPITLLPVGGPRKSAKVLRHERSVLMHSASSSVSSFGSESPMTSSSISLTSLPSSNGSYDVLPIARPGFSDTKHGRSKEAPTPLVIRLNTVSVSPSKNRFASSLPPTPSTAVPSATTKYSFPPTPCTPTFDQSEIKRKRVAKLARHLGETIPPHLISTAPVRSPKAVMAPARKRRSMTVGGVIAIGAFNPVSELGFTQHKPAVSFCPKPKAQARLPVASWVGEWNRDDMREVQKQLRALR